MRANDMSAQSAKRQPLVAIKTLVIMFYAALAAMQLMLLAFLGFSAFSQIACVVVLAGIGAALAKAPGWDSAGHASIGLLICAFAFSLGLFLLGGEGRLFYANTDWTVRNAVLKDLAANPWPFAYQLPIGKMVLRAPLGMYLAPALVGKAMGFRAAEFALLVQNSLLLTLLLGIGSALYASSRHRLIALGVFFGFSGMDVIGQMIVHHPLTLHLEQWGGAQYTANLTQAFWVPQHAMAGWSFALLYLMWVEQRIPRVAMLASAPLLALFSPLALIGCLPFAAWSGIAGLRDKTLALRDFLLPAIVAAISIPGLIYLTAAGSTVASTFQPMRIAGFLIFIAVEVMAYLMLIYAMRGKTRFGGETAAIVIFVLLVAPFGKIGASVDFVMRASIPALAILALIVADLFIRRPAAGDKGFDRARSIALVAFVIGLVTPVSEITRAVLWPRSPEILCSYLGIVPGGNSTYVAQIDRMPALVRPQAPAIIQPHDPEKCWNGAWPDAATGKETLLLPGDLASPPAIGKPR